MQGEGTKKVKFYTREFTGPYHWALKSLFDFLTIEDKDQRLEVLSKIGVQLVPWSLADIWYATTGIPSAVVLDGR